MRATTGSRTVSRTGGRCAYPARSCAPRARRAPAPGGHDAEILPAPRQATAAAAAATPASAEPALPFAGVKFADFSWIGVGPITAKYFADHGATVVRIETESPADRLRNL